MRCVAALLLVACAEAADGQNPVGYPDARIDELADAAESEPHLSDAAPCTGGSVAEEFDGHCYVYHRTAAPDWGTAQSTCAAQVPEMHLATVSDRAEDEFLDGLAGSAETWIGLKRETGLFRWVTGETVGFTDWGAGEPNGPGTRCGRIKLSSWADAPCTDDFGFICERP